MKESSLIPFFQKMDEDFLKLDFLMVTWCKNEPFPKDLVVLGEKVLLFFKILCEVYNFICWIRNVRNYMFFWKKLQKHFFFKKKVPHSLKLVVELISMGLNSITKYLFSLYLQTREKWWTKEQRRHEASKASWPGVQRRPDNKNKFWSKLILLSKKHRSHRPVENSIQEY